MSARMRIIYFGSGEFGVPTLARLAAPRNPRGEHEVGAIVTQPDRPAGRSQRPTPTPIATWAAEHAPSIPIIKAEEVNAPDVVARIREIPCDAFVVIAFGQKLGGALLDGRFAINLHASLLPRWRGAAPINHAILAGDAETGNSVITLADRMDAGLILGQSRRPIDDAVTAGELHDLLAADGPALVLDVLARHAAPRGDVRPIEQDASRVTLAPKLNKADGWVDFAAPALECRRRIHGLTPWPGVTVRFRDEAVRLLRAATGDNVGENDRTRPGGSILDPSSGTIACGGGTTLRLAMVQPAGGRPMPWTDFARGRRVRADEVLIGGKPC